MALDFHSADSVAKTVTFGDPNGVSVTVYLDTWPATEAEAIEQARQRHTGLSSLSKDVSRMRVNTGESAVEL